MTDQAHLEYDSFDARLLAKINGTKLSVGYHNPFLIDDPGLIWLVLKGNVDIFAVPLIDGRVAGTGTHLLRVTAGELIFGMSPMPDPQSMLSSERTRTGLRAVATMGTELFRARRSDIEQDDFDIIVVDWIDRWIAQLADVLAPTGGPRSTGFLEAEPGMRFAAGSILVPQRGDTIWVQSGSGQCAVKEAWPIPASSGDDWFPLAENLWLKCETECSLTGLYTPTALFRGVLWSSLDNLHAVFMGATADRLRRIRQDDLASLERREQTNRATFTAALSKISRILTPSERASDLKLAPVVEDPLHEAVRLVGTAAGIRIAPPVTHNGARLLHPLDDIARRSHIRTRRVILRDDWYRRDNGPLLAYLAEDKRPVALLPESPSRYRMIDPTTGLQQTLTMDLAETLTGEAYVLYQPFPARALRIRDVIKFGASGLRNDISVIITMGLLGGLIALATPIATSQIFSNIIPRADIDMHLMIIAGLVLAAFSTAAFTVTRSFAMLRLQTRMDAKIQTAVWDRLLTLPVPFFRDYSSGDLADRANGINAIREVLSGTVMQTVLNVVFSLFSLVLLFWYSAKLAFIALAIVIVMLGLSFLVTIMQLPLQREIIGRGGKIEGLVFQLLTGLSKLRISASEPRAFARWADQFGITKQLTYRVRGLDAIQEVLTAMFPVITSIILFSVIYFVLNKGASGTVIQPFGLGDFLAFNSALGQFITAMMGLLGTATTLIAIVPLYERVRPILETLPEISELKAEPGAIDGRIEFSGIVFRYESEGPPIINDVSVSIESGSYIAFVGASGSGKSTLVRLLLGFEQPESGGVYIDGRDIASLDMQAVRRQIGVVLQNGRIMAGSIFDNIVGSLPLSIDDAWEASVMAGFDADINNMPMGMHTVLSEGAGALSGGQRQRLMIARALVHKPRILILDEATSALDNRTQDIVNRSLSRMNMTRIVVAHRLSTIQNVDRIFVMDRGRIVEDGCFSELMALNGKFADLARRQMV